jgi:glucose dehydrogenase
MKISVLILGLSLTPVVASSQVIPAPVPDSEVFTRETIGHAVAPPTPNVGKAAPSAANAPPDDGQWSMPSKNYASTRYSSLTEITPDNVTKLEPVVSLSLGVYKGPEAAPRVGDNTK